MIDNGTPLDALTIARFVSWILAIVNMVVAVLIVRREKASAAFMLGYVIWAADMLAYTTYIVWVVDLKLLPSISTEFVAFWNTVLRVHGLLMSLSYVIPIAAGRMRFIRA